MTLRSRVAGDPGKVHRRPALGGTELGPRTKRGHAPVHGEPPGGEEALRGVRIRLENGAGDFFGQRSARIKTKGDEPVDHSRIPLRIQAATIIENPDARLAPPAGAHRNLRPDRGERRFEAVRQDDGLVVLVLDGQPGTAPGTQGKLAVLHVEHVHVPHAGHPGSENRGGAGGEHVDLRRAVPRHQNLHEAVRHDHVAYPRRRDDQNTRAAFRHR